jgi:proteasome lid subunit RPN8/RPN11
MRTTWRDGLQRIASAWRALRGSSPTPPLNQASLVKPAEPVRPLASVEKVVLTDGVCHALFEQYSEHRQSKRGNEETGWVLMGHRLEHEVLAMATLPAGAGREAGVAHVRFNSDAQVVASRILRQQDKQLGIVGVVHTHPGSLRHPSNGDYRGDLEWVQLLRGRTGVFGIGTADGEEGESPFVASQPRRHSQCFLGLRFTWYALAAGDKNYRALPVQVTLGPDLARPLHKVWPALEAHAQDLEPLCRRLRRIEFDVEPEGAALHVIVPMEDETSIRVILTPEDAQYYLVKKGQWLASSQREPHFDRGVYLTLAALAAS